MSVEKIQELAFRRFNLINELQHINTQLLVQYEMLMMAAAKGQPVDINAIAKVLNDSDIHAVKSRMPVLSKLSQAPVQNTPVQEEVKVNPIVEDVIDSSNVKPHITDPDENVDDKSAKNAWNSAIEEIKKSDNYLASIRTNKINIEKVKKQYNEMSDDKKIDYRTKNVPIITAKIAELNKIDMTKDPKTSVATELSIQFYKDYLSCITSK